MKTSTGFILTISCLLLILDCFIYQYSNNNKEYPFGSEYQYNPFDIPCDATTLNCNSLQQTKKATNE